MLLDCVLTLDCLIVLDRMRYIASGRKGDGFVVDQIHAPLKDVS